LGIDGAVDIFYNTIVVNGDKERGWVCISVILGEEFAKKFLYPFEPRK
jgi:hypothetical protein